NQHDCKNASEADLDECPQIPLDLIEHVQHGSPLIAQERDFHYRAKSTARLLPMDGSTAILLPSTHPVCYPFIEVGRAHSSLYSSKPHTVSDNVAHPCENDHDALVF